MIIVSEKSIEKAIDYIESIPESDIQEYIDTAATAQPSIIAYAMATGNDLKQEHSENLLYYTFVIHEAYKAEIDQLPMVSEEILMKSENAYLKNLERLELSENYEDGVLEAINNTDQPALLSYIASVLMDDSPDEEEIEEEVAEEGTLFSALQIIIDSFNNVINNKS